MARKKDTSPTYLIEDHAAEQVQAETPAESAPVEQTPAPDPQLAQAMETVTALQNSLTELQDLHKAVIDELKGKHQSEIAEINAEHEQAMNEAVLVAQSRIDPKAVPLAKLRELVIEDTAGNIYVLDPYRTSGTYMLRPIGKRS